MLGRIVDDSIRRLSPGMDFVILLKLEPVAEMGRRPVFIAATFWGSTLKQFKQLQTQEQQEKGLVGVDLETTATKWNKLSSSEQHLVALRLLNAPDDWLDDATGKTVTKAEIKDLQRLFDQYTHPCTTCGLTPQTKV